MTVYRSKTIWEKDKNGVLIPRCREIRTQDNKYPKPTEAHDGTRTDGAELKPDSERDGGTHHGTMAATPANPA